MFIGHFAVALAAKTKAPKLPLWTLMSASQLLDFGWCALVLAGIEKVRIDPTLKGSPFDLYDMPYTHSLPAAILWSLVAGIAAYFALSRSRLAAVLIVGTVFSHWLLDLLVHRPDLSLGISGIKLGFGLWNWPDIELTLELTLFFAAALLWWRDGGSAGRIRALALLSWLLTLQLINEVMPLPSSPAMAAISALAAYVSVALMAWRSEVHNELPMQARPSVSTNDAQ
jgi:hypothetical protein